MNWKRVSVDRECTVHALPIVNLLIGSAENWSLFRHFYRERQRETLDRYTQRDRQRTRERERERERESLKFHRCIVTTLLEKYIKF